MLWGGLFAVSETRLRDFTPSLPPFAISERDHRTLIADCFNRLYPSRVHRPDAPPRRAMIRLLFSEDTSSRNLLREAREKLVDRISIRRESLRYVSELEFIEIRSYACSMSETSLQKGTDSLVTLLTALFEKNGLQSLNT